jgi:hypothetical protein
MVLIAFTRHRDEKPYPSCIEVDSMIRSTIRMTLSNGYGTHSLHSSSRREAVPILYLGGLHDSIVNTFALYQEMGTHSLPVHSSSRREAVPILYRGPSDSMIRPSIRMPYIRRWVLIACTRHRDEKPYPSLIEVDSMIRSSIRMTLSNGYGTHSLLSSWRREAVPILYQG